MAKNVGKQGRVIRRYRSNIPIEDFPEWGYPISTKQRGYGLYALYQGDKLMYVGRATKSIRSRIKRHKHEKPFTTFSVFLVTGKSPTAKNNRIRDLEALLLNIIKPGPRWNKQGARFIDAKKLSTPANLRHDDEDEAAIERT